ncbi:MAG TPA: hypothetical protein VG845_04870 [Dehalococcoidia bacterium]|nr:hypothetical protein [Dehalococcoidia bacterium]
MAGIAVEEFLPNSATVREGDSIEFVNPYEEIHTVTYTIDEVSAFVMPAGPPLVRLPSTGDGGLLDVDKTALRGNQKWPWQPWACSALGALL